MSDLFGDRGTPSTPDKDAMRFDWLIAFCRERFGVAEDWRWYRWERKEYDKPHEFMIIEGAVCHGVYTRGKHKGRTNWKLRDKSTERTFVIRRDEIEQFQHEWSGKTGLCFECYGTGEDWAGWSAKEGDRYKPCRHCGATGKAAAKAA